MVFVCYVCEQHSKPVLYFKTSGRLHAQIHAVSTRVERENLDGDAKGKGTSGSNREVESTDAPERGGLLRSSDEAGVMPVERRGWVTAVARRRDCHLVAPQSDRGGKCTKSSFAWSRVRSFLLLLA